MYTAAQALGERKRLMGEQVPRTCQFDYREHFCGCVTVFDLARWRSVALNRCVYHGDLESRAAAPVSAGLDGGPR